MHRLNIKGEMIVYQEAIANLSKSDEEVSTCMIYCLGILLILKLLHLCLQIQPIIFILVALAYIFILYLL